MTWRFHFPLRNYDFNTVYTHNSILPQNINTSIALFCGGQSQKGPESLEHQGEAENSQEIPRPTHTFP